MNIFNRCVNYLWNSIFPLYETKVTMCCFEFLTFVTGLASGFKVTKRHLFAGVICSGFGAPHGGNPYMMGYQSGMQGQMMQPAQNQYMTNHKLPPMPQQGIYCSSCVVAFRAHNVFWFLAGFHNIETRCNIYYIHSLSFDTCFYAYSGFILLFSVVWAAARRWLWELLPDE